MAAATSPGIIIIIITIIIITTIMITTLVCCVLGMGRAAAQPQLLCSSFRGMQAALANLAHDLSAALTTAVVVRASGQPCPACICSPSLHCPPLTCSCPSGEGFVSAEEAPGWALAAVAGIAVVAFTYGLGVGAWLFGGRRRQTGQAAPQAAPTAAEDLRVVAALQAKAAIQNAARR